MLWVGIAVGIATLVKYAVNDVPAKAVEYKRIKKLTKKRKKVPKNLRDAKLISANYVITDKEIEKLYKCPHKCLKKINEAEFRAEALEKTGMMEKAGFGKKCRTCKRVHPV